MSQASAREFLSRANSDDALLARLKTAEDMDAIVRIAQGEGFQVSADELKAANRAERGEREVEGSEVQLMGLCLHASEVWIPPRKL